MSLISRWRKTVISAVLALLAATGYIVWERPARLAANETRRALAVGKYDDARRAAERWINLRPNSAEAHFLLAKSALALGRRRLLVDGMLKAKSFGFPEYDLGILQALIDVQVGRLDQARPILSRAFNEAKEPDLMVDEALARALMELYDWPHAGAVLTRWGQDAPNDFRPPLWHAAVNRRRDADPVEIAADFREALKRFPGLAEARLGLAEELARLGRHREAEPEFLAYLNQSPDDPLGFLGAGRNSLELGDLDTAVQRFERALALDPDNGEVHLELARFTRLRGDEAATLAHLDKAIALRPYDPAPRYNRRLALIRLKRPEEARQEQERLDALNADLEKMNDLRTRLNENPKDADLQSRLAVWMFSHGFDQEGLKWARKILADHPRHRATCALLATYYEKQGNQELASYYQSQIGSPRGQ